MAVYLAAFDKVLDIFATASTDAVLNTSTWYGSDGMANWFEYLYADLGSTNDAIAVSTAIESVHQNVTEHLVRLGVNYRFSGL